MHLDLLAIGFGLGAVAVAASVALSRPPESVDDGWIVAGLAIAVVGVAVAADQMGAATIAIAAAAAAAGGWLGHWRATSARALDADLAALVVTAVVFAALPDTEGSTLLGTALVPVTIGAFVLRTRWHGAAAGAAVGALATSAGVVAVDSAANRGGALVVTLLGAAFCAAAVVLVARVLVAPAPPLTNERERPSP